MYVVWGWDSTGLLLQSTLQLRGPLDPHRALGPKFYRDHTTYMTESMSMYVVTEKKGVLRETSPLRVRFKSQRPHHRYPREKENSTVLFSQV